MSSYTLTNTAADIDSAIARVVTADSAPIDNSSNMVTSGGVKGYVDAQISSSAATLSTAIAGVTPRPAGTVVSEGPYTATSQNTYYGTNQVTGNMVLVGFKLKASRVGGRISDWQDYHTADYTRITFILYKQALSV